MTFSYSPTIACCPHILILRACNYFMMPEVGVTPAFFMGQSSWADVLMFDKWLFLERQWPCQEKEWNTRGASQFLPGVCVCAQVLMPSQIGKPKKAWKDSGWHWFLRLEWPGQWLRDGPFLPEPLRAYGYCLSSSRQEFGLLYNLFSKHSCWVGRLQLFMTLLPGKRYSTCTFDPTVVGQAYQVGQPGRSCCT